MDRQEVAVGIYCYLHICETLSCDILEYKHWKCRNMILDEPNEYVQGYREREVDAVSSMIINKLVTESSSSAFFVKGVSRYSQVYHLMCVTYLRSVQTSGENFRTVLCNLNAFTFI